MLRSPASRAAVEHRPVTAQDKKHIRFARQLGFLIAPLFAEQDRRSRVQNHIDASSPEPGNHIVQRTLDLRKLRLCQNPDTFASSLSRT